MRRYLTAGLLDEVHVAVVPVLLGTGERLSGDLGTALDVRRWWSSPPSARVTRVRLRR